MAIPIWDALNVQHSRNIKDKVSLATADGVGFSSAQRDFHLNNACRIWIRLKVMAQDWNALRSISAVNSGTLSSATIALGAIAQASSILTDSAYTVAANGLDITNFGASVTVNYVGGTFVGIDNGTPVTRVIAAFVGAGAFTLGGTPLTAGSIVTTAFVIPPANGGLFAVKKLTATNTTIYVVNPLPKELYGELYNTTTPNSFISPAATRPYYVIRGTTLTVYPTASFTSAAYTLEWIRQHSPLTANTGSTDLPIEPMYHDEILKLALIEAEKEKVDPQSTQKIQLLNDPTIMQEANSY